MKRSAIDARLNETEPSPDGSLESFTFEVCAGTGVLISTEGRCVSIFGRTAEQLRGRVLTEWIHPSDVAPVTKLFASLRKGKDMPHQCSMLRALNATTEGYLDAVITCHLGRTKKTVRGVVSLVGVNHMRRVDAQKAAQRASSSLKRHATMTVFHDLKNKVRGPYR